jgi:hypothetical protein
MERVRADAGLTPATMPEEEAVFHAALARYEKPAGGAYAEGGLVPTRNCRSPLSAN